MNEVSFETHGGPLGETFVASYQWPALRRKVRRCDDISTHYETFNVSLWPAGSKTLTAFTARDARSDAIMRR